jgi:Cu(I)/Ag(I) efflux system membrane protein CusA/SilA
MLLYLNTAWRARQSSGQVLSCADLDEAITEGALRRLRPKVMTVLTIILGLMPLLIGHGAGSEVLRRIAAPMVGGMVSAIAHARGRAGVVYAHSATRVGRRA